MAEGTSIANALGIGGDKFFGIWNYNRKVRKTCCAKTVNELKQKAKAALHYDPNEEVVICLDCNGSEIHDDEVLNSLKFPQHLFFNVYRPEWGEEWVAADKQKDWHRDNGTKVMVHAENAYGGYCKFPALDETLKTRFESNGNEMSNSRYEDTVDILEDFMKDILEDLRRRDHDKDTDCLSFKSKYRYKDKRSPIKRWMDCQSRLFGYVLTTYRRTKTILHLDEYEDHPICCFIYYDTEPCQRFLDWKMQTSEAFRRKVGSHMTTLDLIKQCIKDNLDNICRAKLPVPARRRHPVYQARQCLCQIIEDSLNNPAQH